MKRTTETSTTKSNAHKKQTDVAKHCKMEQPPNTLTLQAQNTTEQNSHPFNHTTSKSEIKS